MADVEALLDRYARFGVDLGLDRVEALLTALGSPQRQVPVIHVAGTNGKGSVCAYLSAVLTAVGYRVGRYTSPHLVSWTERICLNEQPITEVALRSLLIQVHAAAQSLSPTPTQFEVITAAAFSYFAQQQADVAVLEVGLGGRLDATNVCPDPLVSVIVSIGRDHWQRLGPTLADIAGEKAGILKPGRPTVVGPLPAAAQAVVQQRAEALGCAVTWAAPARAVGAELEAGTEPIRYRQVLPGDHQQVNSGVAIAAIEILRQQGWKLPTEAIQRGMAQVRWPGRLQWTPWQGQPLLLDGAHNADAAKVLRQYVDAYLERHPGYTTWLMGMLATKDHKAILQTLLRPGDRLHLVPVADHQSATPDTLAQQARSVCPNLGSVATYTDLTAGLAGLAETQPECSLRVLCGSLYLLGQFLAIHPPPD